MLPPETDIIMLVGLPASGKSEWTNKFKKDNNFKRICPDKIRLELTGSEEDQSKNKEVFELAFERFADFLKDDKKVIIDATNYCKKNRAGWLKIAKKYGKNVVAIVFRTPFDVCIDRNSRRNRTVPVHVIERMAKSWEEPSVEEGFLSIISSETN